jgi:hypothetical protein
MTCKPNIIPLYGPHRAIRVLLVAIALAACSDDEPRTEREIYENIGKVCLVPTDGGTTALVEFDQVCLTCDEAIPSCTAIVTGERIGLTSRLEVTRYFNSDTLCPTVCSTVTARCDVTVPATRAYDFTFGSRSASAVLPVANPVRLFGEGSCGE